jgi:serine/threonine protein kinase
LSVAAENYFESGARVGDYTIERELVREESGVVYQATHLVLPRKAHVKVMAGEFSRPLAVQLLREACLLEALQHPGIPRVYECGVLPDRKPWVATQRIDGVSMQSSLGDGPIPIADLVVVVRDVADILTHVHQRGVVHTKISAETIVRTPERPLAVYLRGWSGARTVESTQSLDIRDDVFALGAVAFRALTGCLHTPSVSATEWCPSAPSELTALIDVMLDANPRVRPTSEEVRERARWLSTTLEVIEPLEIGKPRWTPPNGIDPETHETLPVPATSSAFSIRITRSITK